MKLIHVIKSYVGHGLDFGPIHVRPWCHTEVDHEVFSQLSGDVALALKQAIRLRQITVQMVADDKPVDRENERLVLQMAREAVAKPVSNFDEGGN